MVRRLLIVFGYLLATAAVVGFTVGLVAYGRGYRYDFKTQAFIQTGKVIIQSQPSRLPVTVDGRVTKKKTTYQVSFRPGSYTFELARDGYYTWKKKLTVVAAEVTLAQYVLLIPKNPKTEVLDARSSVVAQTVSRDHKHLAYVTGGSDAGLYAIDPDSSKPARRIYTGAAATETTPVEVITNVSWSDDASHLLVVSTVGDQTIHRLMNASGGEVRNLTSETGSPLLGLQFSGNDWQQLYWLAPDGLRRLSVGDQVTSTFITDRVSQFTVTEGRVLYVQAADVGRSLWSVDDRLRRQQVVQALPESDSYSLAYTSYRGTDELAVVPTKSGIATLYTDVYGSHPSAKTLAQSVSNVTFSPDGHLLLMWSQAHATSYDLERSAVEHSLILFEFPGWTGSLSSVSWFDDFHLLQNREGRLVWSEFDGQNEVDLGATAPGLAPFGSDDLKTIYNFVPRRDKLELTSWLIRP